MCVCLKLAAGAICLAVCVPWSGGRSECREKRDLFRSPAESSDLQCTFTLLYLNTNTIQSMEINREGSRRQRIKEQWRTESKRDEEQRLHYFDVLHHCGSSPREYWLKKGCFFFAIGAFLFFSPGSTPSDLFM